MVIGVVPTTFEPIFIAPVVLVAVVEFDPIFKAPVVCDDAIPMILVVAVVSIYDVFNVDIVSVHSAVGKLKK
jgi:hypothetical protein